MKHILRIKDRFVGEGNPCFVVAELSCNHHQNFDEAVALVKKAAEAGVDAVKLQTYTPDTITINSDKEFFLVGGKGNPDSWKNKTLYELYQKAYTPWEWHSKLKKIAEDLGLIFFSTPFDGSAVDFLEEMDVSCYKIASYEIVHIPLLEKIAETRKPIILSTPLASLEDIELAISTLRDKGIQDIAVLYGVNTYQKDAKKLDIHLSTMRDIEKHFGVVVGLSDNNAGIEVPVIAATMGASIIEKHFILDRAMGGYDARFSIIPDEMKEMVRQIRDIEKLKGVPHYGPISEEERYNLKFRPSVFIIRDIKKGDIFTRENIRVIRPSNGLHPKFYEEIIGKKVTQDIERGTPLSIDLIE